MAVGKIHLLLALVVLAAVLALLVGTGTIQVPGQEYPQTTTTAAVTSTTAKLFRPPTPSTLPKVVTTASSVATTARPPVPATLKPQETGSVDGYDYVMVKSPPTEGYLGTQYDSGEFYTLTRGNQTYYLVFTPIGVAFRIFEKVNKMPEDFKWSRIKNVYVTYSILGKNKTHEYTASCWVTYNKSYDKKFVCLTLVEGDEGEYLRYLSNVTSKYPPKEPLKADYWTRDIPEKYWAWKS
jgi:hypothetical protein